MAREIVDLAKAGKEEVQTLVREDKEKIRFSTLTALAHVFFPSWLKSLQPYIVADQFVVRTEYDTAADYFAAVEDSSVDFFVCYEDPRNRFFNDDSVFVSLNLGEERLVPVISPDENGAPRWWLPDKPAGPIPCLHTLTEHSPSPVRFHMASKYSHLSFKSVYESTNAPTLKTMAIEGFGLAWVPSAHVAADLASGRLVRAAELADDLFVEINIYRSSRHDELRVEKFWQALVQQKTGQRG